MKLIQKRPLLIAIITTATLLIIVAVLLLRTDRSSIRVNPKRGPIIEAIYGIGTVTSRKHFTFRLGVNSTVVKTYVHEGQEVKKGDALIQLTPSLMIRTPINGTVTSFSPNEGENIFPDQTVVTVEDLLDRYILATIDQQSALRVKKGMKVRLHFETIRDQTFNGTVNTLYPSSGQFMVRIESQELPPEILPGMTADVSIQVAERENALLIPVLSIQQGKVLIERNGKNQKIDVKIGVTDSEWAEVLSGDISESDVVVRKK